MRALDCSCYTIIRSWSYKGQENGGRKKKPQGVFTKDR